MDNDIIISKISELSAKVDYIYKDVAELYKKYEKIEQDSNNNNTSVQTILVKIENMSTQMNEINKTLKDLSEKPAKNWNQAMATIISSILTGVIAFAIAKFTGK